MKLRVLVPLLVGVAVVAGGVWWWSHRPRVLKAAPAEFAITWQGRRRGRMTLPAQLRWCPVTRTGVIEAVSGDTGVAVVVYEQNAVTAGAHPVVNPDVGASSPKPDATVAMRWMRFDRDSALEQFRSQSGVLQIRLAGNAASGDLTARMRAPAGAPADDTIVVHAVFRDVPMVTTAVGCT